MPLNNEVIVLTPEARNPTEALYQQTIKELRSELAQSREVADKLAEALKQSRTDFLEFEGCYCGQLLNGTDVKGEPLHICGWCTTEEALALYVAHRPAEEAKTSNVPNP